MAGGDVDYAFLPTMLPLQIDLAHNLIYNVRKSPMSVRTTSIRSGRQAVEVGTAADPSASCSFRSVASVFDFMMLYAMLAFFMLARHCFQTGWVVEVDVNPTLVVFAFRTDDFSFAASQAGSRRHDHRGARVAIVLRFPLGRWFGLVAHPPLFFGVRWVVRPSVSRARRRISKIGFCSFVSRAVNGSREIAANRPLLWRWGARGRALPLRSLRKGYRSRRRMTECGY